MELSTENPNDKLYDLRYADGGQWRYKGEVRQYSLREAIGLADHAAGQERVTVYVVDPGTGTVLWSGQEAMR